MSSDENNYDQRSIDAHKKHGGKIRIESKMPLDTREDLSVAYTPGVAEPCRQINNDNSKAYDYTWKKNTVAVVSDGSAVLGLGNIGPEASLPVMEGKCVLFKKFAGVDAVPVVLDTQDIDEMVTTIKHIARTYGGINLEDIGSPRCFEIERRLKDELSIPVMHDDQHGTAIVTLAGMINAMRVTGRNLNDLKVVINGSGAAGVAIVKLLQHVGVRETIMCDSRGTLYKGRGEMNSVKKEMAKITNRTRVKGSLGDALEDADVFIGVSVPDVLKKKMIKRMRKNPIIFAMANPIPEIMPAEAHEAKAGIVATGRSDFPNQINNVLAFPGLFRGALNARTSNFSYQMYVAAAYGIANCVEDPTPEEIIPSAFDKRVAKQVADIVEDVCEQNNSMTF
ncbi:malate dehydrogenase (oxaloacetate-decarboxylating) [Fodinibius salinus]|uniref:Malate dehydrogenase (Oxaloacetate-decarboxylating) n=1 Tax=Fodinibius salinus TaxID=860790 RepID=A0A5D3YIS6_9BACT|nr:NADP-dependent malic enzyme [Fodinibius salinus]TYP93465.1 malate dehydrogenase (oxaloacetate-decarboxylating) [Fodinibius salinus]